MSLSELANDALFVQDACNLSGVVHSFSTAMTRLRELIPGKDTDFYNRHPIAVMYSSKLADMTKCYDNGTFIDAMETCEELKGELCSS